MIYNFQFKKSIIPQETVPASLPPMGISLKHPSLLLREWLPKVESNWFILHRLHWTTRMFFWNQTYQQNHLKMSTIFSLHTLNQQMKDLSSQSCQSVINNSHVTWAALPQATAWLYSLLMSVFSPPHTDSSKHNQHHSILKIGWLFRGIIFKAR